MLVWHLVSHVYKFSTLFERRLYQRWFWNVELVGALFFWNLLVLIGFVFYLDIVWIIDLEAWTFVNVVLLDQSKRSIIVGLTIFISYALRRIWSTDDGVVVLVWDLFFLDYHNWTSLILRVEVQSIWGSLLWVCLRWRCFRKDRWAIRLLSSCLDSLVIGGNFNILRTRVCPWSVSIIAWDWWHMIGIIVLKTLIWREFAKDLVECRLLDRSLVVDNYGITLLSW